MLYSEFIAGTDCKDNTHNFNVYKRLEVMYMNSDITKEEIFEYGKKLVDNDVHELVEHKLPYLVISDHPFSSYVAARFLVKEAAEEYVKMFRSCVGLSGEYIIVHEDNVSDRYDKIIKDDKI